MKNRKMVAEDKWGVPNRCQWMMDPVTNRVYYIKKCEPISHPPTDPMEDMPSDSEFEATSPKRGRRMSPINRDKILAKDPTVEELRQEINDLKKQFELQQ